MAASMWAVFIFPFIIPVCLASGALEFHVISFSSNCRETFSWDKCDHYLAFCFDKATNNPEIWSCAYKRQETGVYDNNNDITFGNNMKGVPNPIMVPIKNFSDPRVLLVMRSMDKDDTSEDELVVTVSRILTLFPSSSRPRASYKKDTASRDGSTFVYEFMTYCDSNLYGPQCTVFCQAQNNPSGHYNCNPDTGAKECHTGWEGTNCAVDANECSNNSSICYIAAALNPKLCINSPGSYSCACPAGWKGSNCEQDINECENNATNPCRNGGTCNNAVGSYRCDCPHNWSGSNCTDDVDECSHLTSPCTLNGTRCNNTQGGYSCVCVKGWKGDNCTEDVNECLDSNSPCKNGGTCNNTIGSFKCYCPRNWTGDSCLDDVDECSFMHTTLCELNNTWCNNTKGGYLCVCVQGWQGDNCTEDVNECLDGEGLCENGGICLNVVGSYRCKCTSGWTGPACTEDLDECSSKLESPCASPNFKCENDFGNYSCVCADGWKGRNCTEDVDECIASNSTCKNGGNCTNSPGSFSCECQENWTGPTCSEDVDECSTIRLFPCPSSNYKCLNTIGNYSCACADGWRGDKCEDDVDECGEGHVTCKNNGSCVNLAGGYRCDCQPGWGGVSCAVDIDECAHKPCTAAGEQCVNVRGAYQCVCPEGSTVCGQTSIIQVEEKSFLIWPIIVAVAALIVIIILIAIIIVCRRKRRKEKPMLGRPLSHIEVGTFQSDLVMFENCLYHAGSRRLAEHPVSDPTGSKQIVESFNSSFTVKGRTESTSSDHSTRPRLPVPPAEGTSDYDTLHEEPVYHDIDDAGSRRPLDWGDPQKEKVQPVAATDAYVNGGVTHLDTRPHSGQKNMYEDFDSLQQAAAVLKASRVDDQGYMEPTVLRALSLQREREPRGENVDVKERHDKPLIACRMNVDGMSNEGFDRDNKSDHNHYDNEQLEMDPQHRDPAEGSFTKKDEDGGQNIPDWQDKKNNENDLKRSGQDNQNENNKPAQVRFSIPSDNSDSFDNDHFDGQDLDVSHYPEGAVSAGSQNNRNDLRAENKQAPKYKTFGEDDVHGNVEASTTDHQIQNEDDVDPEDDPLQFITGKTARTNGSVTIEPMGETADDDDHFDANRDDDDEAFPHPPSDVMWQYPLYEIARKPAAAKAFF